MLKKPINHKGKNIVNDLNDIISKYTYFEMMVSSFEKANLTIVGSEDILYYHNLSICFHKVDIMIIGTNFIVDPKKPVISIITETEEARLLHIKFKVLVGNLMFKLLSQDGVGYYIAAEDLTYKNELVKYYN